MTVSKASEDQGTRKLGLSCAECRRSKLRCDRTFPCQSCIRRGCSGICPEGTLAATKGNKILMAQAQKLTEENKMLNERIQELEAALALAQVQPTRALTRMQSNNSIHIKEEGGEEKPNGLSASMGSLSLGVDGKAKFHGESAGAEYLQDLYGPSEEDIINFKPASVPLPVEIMTLVHAFPFGLKDCPFNKSIFLPFVPPKQMATELATIYYRNVAWMYDPISYEDFLSSVINPVYGDYGLASYASIDGIHSHRLSILFIVLAHGRLFLPQASAQIIAEQYQLLARAAISFDSILMEATIATVQALFLLFRFIYDADIAAKEERWLLTGLTVRIAHTIGLQRDGTAWNLESDEVQRRRRLYWELYVWESWTSIVHGRPCALLIQHTDCRYADDLDPSISAGGEIALGFHAWKSRYSATCLSISVDHVFSTKSPSYTNLLKIEKTIKTFPVPRNLIPNERGQNYYSWSLDVRQALQQYCTLCVIESNLLYIHRSYFAQAIKYAPNEPQQHKYGRSVTITQKSAIRLIKSLHSLFPICPAVGQVWFFWSGIYSACIALGILVITSPRCGLAREAFTELEAALPFFEAGSRHCRPPSTLTLLQKMYDRAKICYSTLKSGFEKSFDPLSEVSSKEPDELEVIGGHKSVITPKSSSNSPSYGPREGPGGSSPPSHSGAAESLMALRNQMDAREPLCRENRDFELPHQSSQFQTPINSSMMETDHSPVMGPSSALLQIIPKTPPGRTCCSQAELLSRNFPQGGPWQLAQTDYHSNPNVLQTYGSPIRECITYDDSPPMRDVLQGSLPHSPSFPPPVTQDEIWKNFFTQFQQ